MIMCLPRSVGPLDECAPRLLLRRRRCRRRRFGVVVAVAVAIAAVAVVVAGVAGLSLLLS